MEVYRLKKEHVCFGLGGFKVGDQIYLGEGYTATCQKVSKNAAIFLFDQYLDETMKMFDKTNIDDFTYEHSIVYAYLNGLINETTIFSDELKDMMVPFNKTGVYLRIPTIEEMGGGNFENFDKLSCKKQWPLMCSTAMRCAFRKGSDNVLVIEEGWLQNKCKNNGVRFAVITATGRLATGHVVNKRGIRPVFKLSNDIEYIWKSRVRNIKFCKANRNLIKSIKKGLSNNE